MPRDLTTLTARQRHARPAKFIRKDARTTARRLTYGPQPKNSIAHKPWQSPVGLVTLPNLHEHRFSVMADYLALREKLLGALHLSGWSPEACAEVAREFEAFRKPE